MPLSAPVLSFFRVETKINTNLTEWLEEFKGMGAEPNAWVTLGFWGVRSLFTSRENTPVWGKSKAGCNNSHRGFTETKDDYF